MEPQEWMALERIFSTVSCAGILLMLVWRLPALVQQMLDFGRQIAMLNAEVLKEAIRENSSTIKATQKNGPSP
jgi:glutamine synthetase adenylyltransferase